MTDIPLEKQPSRRFDFPRILPVLTRPRKAFVELASESRATWLTPMLVLTVTSLLFVLVTGYLKTQAAMMGEVTLPPDWQWWTPEMQDTFMQVGTLLKPQGLTYWTFLITQILLAILSLYNIMIYVYSDMRIVYLRSKKMMSLVQDKIEKE